ncbi:MAG: penicillin-binding protein 1A [Rhodospirillales bacterium]|nr:penicillin-binding protein 1A [Rhodospirillales bacterium]
MRVLRNIILALLSIGILALSAGIGAVIWAIGYYGRDLPDYSQLKDYDPPRVSRLYAGDGRLLAEYAEERRVFIPIDTIPDLVKHAFIAAEDENFYRHHGVDYYAIARASLANIRNILHDRRLEGASTITQQVAKNFLLSNEVSFSRKIREAILAFRMEKSLSKDKILELYLNEIYLGSGSYGVAAAALNYFNKSLNEIDIEEAAYLAALPKAPNNYHPIKSHDKALARRNWVIGQMAANGFIAPVQAEIARAKPLQMAGKDPTDTVDAPYFAEEVRRELQERFGTQGVYAGGLAVRTSVDPKFQEIALKSLRAGLMAYDQRHGWRGPIAHLAMPSEWESALPRIASPRGKIEGWELAAVLKVGTDGADIGFAGGRKGLLPLEQAKWARKSGGPDVTAMSQVVEKGDVILVEPVVAENNTYALRQIPKIQGAILALDPHTGRVLAMQGGWTYGDSEYNRATQAWRQPGSAFKPFVYLAALDKGFTPATLILDAPFVMEQRPGVQWSPNNYTHEFYGPTPLRVGIEKSRNLMTVRLADHIGMDTIADYAERFGVVKSMPPYLSAALGAVETTLLRLTTGYAQIVNGGKKITPTFVDRIQDRRGKTVFTHDHRVCTDCGTMLDWQGQPVPEIPDDREQIGDPRTTYQMVSIMEGVVQRGTATRLKSLPWPLAGKTGTTNESKDTWFIGFTPDLVVGVFVGFDDPESMGKRETGASVALPVFKDFMENALKGVSPMPFRVPPGMRQVQINSETGVRARPGDSHVIWESFIAGTEPNGPFSTLLNDRGLSAVSSSLGETTLSPSEESLGRGTGGIY